MMVCALDDDKYPEKKVARFLIFYDSNAYLITKENKNIAIHICI